MMSARRSPNRCVYGFAPYDRSTQIPSLRSGTSHTLRTLSEVGRWLRERKYLKIEGDI